MGSPRLPSVYAVVALLFSALVLGLGSLGACNKPRPPAPPPAEPKDPTRFPHAQHASAGCESCHPSDGSAQGLGRPGGSGGDAHSACDGGQCHRAAFLAAPGRLCTNCHTAVTAGATGVSAPLQPFPRTTGWRNLPSTFSHTQHLDAPLIEAAVGFHLSCSDCHAATESGAPAHPDHAVCARCHAAEVALPRAPAMAACAACHSIPGARPRGRARLIKGDLHFSHGNHRVDRAGAPIPCAACHRDTAEADDYDDHRPPAVASCVPCHDDDARVPSEQRMRACETCHSGKRGSLVALAPRNHLPGTERPIDHTLSFRTDHGDAAFRDASRCATCHTVMSGSPRDACDECHRAVAPVDHRLAWRELEHGTEAAAAPERCALCHNADTCTDCHNQTPRSHLPLTDFVTNHGLAARVNVRACLTCHTPEGEQGCARAGCHVADGTLPTGPARATSRPGRAGPTEWQP